MGYYVKNFQVALTAASL
ncbi:hypothetical protein YPPY14_3171, partial [Yersinia pestis PY-14]